MKLEKDVFYSELLEKEIPEPISKKSEEDVPKLN